MSASSPGARPRAAALEGRGLRQIGEKLLLRMWDSPVATSWASFGVRFGSLVLVTPLLLRQFPAEEVALWYLLSGLAALQVLTEFGFSSTFIRAVAYAWVGRSGGRPEAAIAPASCAAPDWPALGQIYGTMRRIFGALAVLSLAIFSAVGWMALLYPISQVEIAQHGWISWGVTLAGTSVLVWGNLYSSFLQGVGQIVRVRRLEIAVGIGGLSCSLVLLACDASLPFLVANVQLWSVLGVILNARAIKVDPSYLLPRQPAFDPVLFGRIWPQAWRSGIGVLCSAATFQLGGLIYAQLVDAATAASYLLALRLVTTVSAFSQAPFYSIVPHLNSLFAQNDRARLLETAEKAMRLSYWSYAGPVIILGLAAAPLLQLIDSEVRFVEPGLWALLSIAFLAERYGAMHIQLYSVSSHIVWHIANGISALIYFLLLPVLVLNWGAYGLAASMFLANAFFYAWYTSLKSHRLFGLAWPSFDWRTVGFPAMSILAYAAISPVLN